MNASIFCCPVCKGPLAHTPDAFACSPCDRRFDVVDGIPDFPVPGPDYPEDLNLVYHRPEMAEAKDTVFRLGARSLEGMAVCMQEIGRHTAPGSRVLEVALGAGHFTRWLAEVSHPETEIYAYDFSWPMLERAEANTRDCLNATLFRANSRGKMPFAEGIFDIVFVRLAPFKPDGTPDECSAALRFLKPGGWYFNASTVAGERFDTPPTQWALNHGFERAEYRIWRYPRVVSEDAYLAGLIDTPRRPHEIVDMEAARRLTSEAKRLRGKDGGIEIAQVEALLIARKPG